MARHVMSLQQQRHPELNNDVKSEAESMKPRITALVAQQMCELSQMSFKSEKSELPHLLFLYKAVGVFSLET